jgi:hypothetical protein
VKEGDIVEVRIQKFPADFVAEVVVKGERLTRVESKSYGAVVDAIAATLRSLGDQTRE